MTATNKKPLVIALAADNPYAFALASVLMDLKNKSPKLLAMGDVVVYTQNLSDKNRAALLKIMPLNIIEFKLPFDPVEIKTLKRYTQLTMARYHAFDLLNDYKAVVWLDVDIVIKGELLPLLDYPAESGIAKAYDGNLVAANFFEIIEGINYYTPCFNAGIMVLTDKFPNYQTMREWCFEQTKKYAPALDWIDQGILNYSYQVFNIKPALLPYIYNAHPVTTPVLNKDIVILHTMGPEKTWNTYYVKQWNKNYKEWLALGGQPMPKQKYNYKKQIYFYIKLLIEKVPFIWTYYKKVIKKRFLYYNYTLIEKMEKMEKKWN